MIINDKSKKLTLKRAWDGCLKEWKFIVNCVGDVCDAKDCYEYDNNISQLCLGCYFCDYALNKGEAIYVPQLCKCCPGVLACGYNTKRSTLWCEQRGKHWAKKPKQFYKYLQETYKKYRRQHEK